MNIVKNALFVFNLVAQNLYDNQWEAATRWLSCNGESWGVGPTAVFASAAALFLWSELEATLMFAGDGLQIALLEKSLVSSMVMGMLALMIHLWVCSMRFFQYYLDTLIKESPNVLLEMTTAGLLGSGQSELVALGPLTRFLRQQQPQIHITFCWFLSLCYADYVRKHYCTRFNLPYLEQWQAELHERASHGATTTVRRVNSLVGALHRRLRGFGPSANQLQQPQTANQQTEPSPFAAEWMLGANGRPSTPNPREVCVRLVSRASDTTAEAVGSLRAYISIWSYAKCGEHAASSLPTALWTAGAAVLTHKLLNTLFRRSLFRRVPIWELLLQNLLFIWMIIYSLHFWMLLVKLLKVFVDYCYADMELFTPEEASGKKLMQQWMIWMFGFVPLAIYIQTRPRQDVPPMMIWITANPWHRREMGPYGYYLQRPPTSLQSSTNIDVRQQMLTIRRAYSDTSTTTKPMLKKKKYSKSV